MIKKHRGTLVIFTLLTLAAAGFFVIGYDLPSWVLGVLAATMIGIVILHAMCVFEEVRQTQERLGRRTKTK